MNKASSGRVMVEYSTFTRPLDFVSERLRPAERGFSRRDESFFEVLTRLSSLRLRNRDNALHNFPEVLELRR